MVPVLVSSLCAQEKPEILQDYLPVGKLVEGSAINAVLDDGLMPFMQKVDEAFNKLPEKDKKELIAKNVPGQPVPYDTRLGWTKEDYDKYLELWKKKEIQEVAQVAIGLFASGERGIWSLTAMTNQGPLPMSTLKYDSNTKSWISPEGTLALKGDVTYDDMNVYGAWSGKEWTLQKKSILSTLTETVIIGKTKDNQYVYFVYNMSEVNPAGMNIGNQVLVLRIPVKHIVGDPLLEKAKARSLK